MDKIEVTTEELSTIVHALRNNARADRERVKSLQDEQQAIGKELPHYKGLIEIFERQAAAQEKLADRLEA
jgi:hypothetical protein